MIRNTVTAIALCTLCVMGMQAQDITRLWKSPTADYRMKTWWWFGYENTTPEGITADADALKQAGFGGVVYYDQDHRSKSMPDHVGTPDEGFSRPWWQHLKWAAHEAKRNGLSFELNISNGYVAGGRWIDPAHAMQRVAAAKTQVKGGAKVSIALPAITGRDGYVKDIALVAFPTPTYGSAMRHFTAHYKSEGKGRNGAMQKPGPRGKFGGYGWKEYPDLGTLQTSDDSLNWRDVLTIENMYGGQGGYFLRTNAFPATEGRYWRVSGSGTAKLREWSVGPEPMIDRWEERAALHSDFAEDHRTPYYAPSEVIDPATMVDLSGFVNGNTIKWQAPEGDWTVLRLAAVITGAKSKHGRANLLGYECDKLSKEAARVHWNSYVQPILDSLGTDACVKGIAMDSHEGGAQNWTPLMLDEFRSRRGYDLRPWLPALAGYVVESTRKTEQVLADLRQTIADCMRDNYFGTFQQLCTERRLTFTAQAIGNALCIDGDAIAVKKVVDKPQGEFWAYQTDGAYDIKDCSSACHLYGKPIASAEAMTDTHYDNTSFDLMRVSNIAFAMGAQEFVVCATPHVPWTVTPDSLKGKPYGYFAGREYGINRTNPKWNELRPVWLQNARTTVLLRQGKAASDVLVYLGDDIPIKTLTSRLPDGISHLDWDVCTGDALRLMAARGSKCYNPQLADPIEYKAVLVADKAEITPASQAKLDELKRQGVRILTDGSAVERAMTIVQGDDSTIVHTHRIVGDKGKRHHLFYIASISKTSTTVGLRFDICPNRARATLWLNMSGKKSTIRRSQDGTFALTLQPGESVCVEL